MSASTSSRGLIILLLVLVVAAAAWYGWQQFGDNAQPARKTTTVVKSKAPNAQAAAPVSATPITATEPTDAAGQAAMQSTGDTAAPPDKPASVGMASDSKPSSGAAMADASPTTASMAAHDRGYALPHGDLRHCLELKDNRAVAHCAVKPN